MPGALTAHIRPLVDVRHHDDWRLWRRLTDSAPPFLGPDFFLLTRPLAHGEPLVAEAWEGEELVGALPLSLERRSLLALRSDHTPLFDYWGKPEGIDAIWAELGRDRRWDVMMLARIPAASPLVRRFRELAARDGCKAVIRPASPDLFFALPAFESRMHPKFLTNLRRCERKAGGVELERIAVPTRSDFHAALAIEGMAWKGAAGTSIDHDPLVTHLYDAATRLYGRRGRASLNFLRAGGERIALLFSVEDAQTLYALKIGYDPRHAALSPGHLVVWKVAADAERRGLQVFDFGGREDAWKHKWTDLHHDRVTLVIYRRSPRGLALHALRELVKPRLPERMRDIHMPLRAGCQQVDLLGAHSLLERLKGGVERGVALERRLLRTPARSKRASVLGADSRFAPGSWVRVLDEDRLRATLDPEARLRGLRFTDAQREACGRVYRVERRVRRLRDDGGEMRPVSHVVQLEGVTCASGPESARCGRHCPLLFYDEWLEPSGPPSRHPPAPFDGIRAHVRELDEIRAGLDLHGRRDGVTFLAEMEPYVGKRFHVATRVTQVYEHGRWIPPRAAVYLLDGLHCSGAGVGGDGPCERACPLLWHGDWLLLEARTTEPR
ncbi:MAG: GNAT family N-acetyltransferase [Polyangiaceae bacterium]